MPFWEHLEELRWTIVKMIAAVALGACAGWWLYDPAFALLTGPIQNLEGVRLRFDSPLAPFMMKLQVSLVLGVIFSLPLLFALAWSFVCPGLKPGERRLGLWTITAGTGFFLAGVGFAYAMLPLIIRFLATFSVGGVDLSWNINIYLGFVLRILMAFGVLFELPVVIVLLVSLDLVRTDTLRKLRPYAIVLAFLLAAILTPPDIFSQIILGVPLVALYELGIWAGSIQEKRLAKRRALEDDEEETSDNVGQAEPEPTAPMASRETDNPGPVDDLSPYQCRPTDCLEDLPALFDKRSIFEEDEPEP